MYLYTLNLYDSTALLPVSKAKLRGWLCYLRMLVLFGRQRCNHGRVQEAIIYFIIIETAVSADHNGPPVGVTDSQSANKTKMVWVDQQTLFFFSMKRMPIFLRKKECPQQNLASLYRSDVIQVCPCVFHHQREETETRWHSDSRWNSIAIGRPCH